MIMPSRSVLVRQLLMICLLLSFSGPGAAEEQWPELDWLELMPEEDLRLLESLPQVDHEGGGPAALLDEILTGRVVPEMDGTRARIPGFVVPLKTVGPEQRIVEFFLVPYYGACIHVPPPPPNQIIHVTYKPGFTLTGLHEPVWIQGTLKTKSVENDIASSSYKLVSEKVEPYEG
jgi:hypothetical protein